MSTHSAAIASPQASHRKLARELERGYRELANQRYQKAIDRFLALSGSFPHAAPAWHGLGIASAQAGHLEDSLRFLRRACELAPKTALYWSDLGKVAIQSKLPREAASAFSQVMGCGGADLETHFLYGQSLEALGLHQEAITELGLVLAENPRHAPALNALGSVMRSTGRLDEAADLYRQALRCDPRRWEIWHNLAAIHTLGKRWKEAASCAAEAVHLHPQCWQALLALAVALSHQRLYQDAETCLDQALRISGGHADVCLELGNLAMARQHGEQAIQWFLRAADADPGSVGALFNAANLLRLNGELGRALQLIRVALRIQPDNAIGHNLAGLCLSEIGRMRDALLEFQRVVELDPGNPIAHSNLLYNLNFHTVFDADSVARLHLGWGRMAECLPTGSDCGYSPPAVPHQRLRVGYVSSDFRRHSVAYFLDPILRHHNRGAFEVYCYSCVERPDEVTAEFQSLDVVWRDVASASDAALIQTIRQDEIDILIDLAGHTGGNRLAVFAARPAPVQCSYLGYPNTTGLSAIQYRLVDPFTDPPDADASGYSETLERLQPVFLCFSPPPVEVFTNLQRPADRNGYLTVGTFNNNKKIDVATAHAWAALLRRLPGARLLLKHRSYQAPEARQHVLQLLGSAGIDSSRVSFRPAQAGLKEHLEQYNDLDIALDTFPYNGTTTTFEALWMGVPVLTLCGTSHSSRVSGSILTALGLNNCVAHSVDDFAEKGFALAQRIDQLQEYRVALRPRLLASPLMNARRFTAELERFYRRAWTQWQQATGVPARTGSKAEPRFETQQTKGSPK